jgi:hypothetical protein
LPLKEWIDLAVADGRKVAILVDHLELYRKTPEQYREWLEKSPRFQARYPMGVEGHRRLFADFAAAARRRDITLFGGWEVYEGELDTGVDEEALRLADVIGWHISPNNGGAPPDGAKLIRRAEQVVALQKRIPKPMILFHPFTMRVENVMRRAQGEKRSVESIPVSEYRFFTSDQQKRLAEVLRKRPVYVEIAWPTENCFRLPNCREAMIQDVRPLAEMGVQFTVSTDAHGVAAMKRPFRPEGYATALGVTPANVNTLVRELLDTRAKAEVR